MQFAIIAEHAPELCPSSNAKIRGVMRQTITEIPDLAQKLGITIITTNVLGPDHVILAIVEADHVESVRDFVMRSRLVQWNTTRIHPTWSVEEALAKADELPAMF